MRRTLLVLLLLGAAPAIDARDDPEDRRLRDAVAHALREIHLAPDDLRVRDLLALKRNAERWRATGAWAGDWPMPREREPLRSPLIDQTLRTPMHALGVGLSLVRGGGPPELRPLLLDVPPVRAPLGATSWEEFAGTLAARLAILDRRVRETIPRDFVETRVAEWLLSGIEVSDLTRARAAFDRLGIPDHRPLLADARDFVATVREFARERPDRPADKPFRIDTEYGTVLVGTTGSDTYREDVWLIVEPGGDDLYLNNAGGARGSLRTAAVVDLSGDDTYVTRGRYAQGAADHGVGILIDLAGDDVYFGTEFCQGAATAGIGILADETGRDHYRADRFAQGAAAFGFGLLDDRGQGDDRYLVQQLGQGLGRTAGYGALTDDGGDDCYAAGTKYPSKMYSQWTGGRTVHWSFAQGCGFGFYCRYDEPDGDERRRLVTREMFPGGVGLLMDRDGNDRYDGSMYAQGTAYFYGLGLLIDRGGNDRYRATWYGQGAAPHYAVGILVDASGDDVYEGMNQVQGNGRDFSTAVFVDLAGDDRYFGEDRVQGCGDLADGYGIFLDAAGHDVYEATRRTARGFATEKRPERQPRPDRPYQDVGLFLDLGGMDEYRGAGPGENDAIWIQRETGRGVGIDR